MVSGHKAEATGLDLVDTLLGEVLSGVTRELARNCIAQTVVGEKSDVQGLGYRLIIGSHS